MSNRINLDCAICSSPAAGLGPYSARYLCQKHLAIDVEQVRGIKRSVEVDLQQYCERNLPAKLAEEQTRLAMQMESLERKFAELQRQLNEWRTQLANHLTERTEVVKECQAWCNDIAEYKQDVSAAAGAGNMTEVCQLTVSMRAAVPDIRRDFNRAQELRAETPNAGLEALEKLRKMIDDALKETEPVHGDFTVSHEVVLEGPVTWLAVCTDTGKFRSDRHGRIVPIQTALADSAALPQPCLVATVRGKAHLTVLSVDGAVKLRTECGQLRWRDGICGIHCEKERVYVAQPALVTSMDLSGHVVFQVSADAAACLAKFGGICGGPDDALFVSCGNRITAFSNADGRHLEASEIELAQLHDAELSNLTFHKGVILVSNWTEVYSVRVDTKQLVGTHPNVRSGLKEFTDPQGLAVDSRGRVFVSEFNGHSVRALTADDGILLFTLGLHGRRGRQGDRLNKPCGLAVVPGDGTGRCEQLAVADSSNHRLLVLNLH